MTTGFDRRVPRFLEPEHEPPLVDQHAEAMFPAITMSLRPWPSMPSWCSPTRWRACRARLNSRESC